MRKTLLTSALIATIGTPSLAGLAESPGASVNCAGLRAYIESGIFIAPSELTPIWHKITAERKRAISADQRRQLARIYLTYC